MKTRNLNPSENNFDCRMLPGPQYNNETYRKAVLFLHTCELHLYSKYLHWFEDLGGIPFLISTLIVTNLKRLVIKLR